MSSRWWPSAILVAPSSAGDAIEHAASQPRAQRTGGLALGDQALDDRIGVLLLDVEGNAQALEVVGQHVGGKAGLLLVEIDGDDVEMDRRVLAQIEQDVEQAEGILAAGQADHDLVAVLDHVVVGDGLADRAAQPLGQLVGLEGGLVGLACGRHCARSDSMVLATAAPCAIADDHAGEAAVADVAGRVDAGQWKCASTHRYRHSLRRRDRSGGRPARSTRAAMASVLGS